jgi:hypothetical protein
MSPEHLIALLGVNWLFHYMEVYILGEKCAVGEDGLQVRVETAIVTSA